MDRERFINPVRQQDYKTSHPFFPGVFFAFFASPLAFCSTLNPFPASHTTSANPPASFFPPAAASTSLRHYCLSPALLLTA